MSTLAFRPASCYSDGEMSLNTSSQGSVSSAFICFAGLTWLLSIWDAPFGECQQSQIFFGSAAHESQFVHHPQHKVALCHILPWWKVRYIPTVSDNFQKNNETSLDTFWIAFFLVKHRFVLVQHLLCPPHLAHFQPFFFSKLIIHFKSKIWAYVL